MQKNILIFMGPQGSGKSTQAQLIKDFLIENDSDNDDDLIFHFDTGQRFRQFMAEPGYTRERINESISQGNLQPDWLPNWLFTSALIDEYKPHQHILIDGFPRSVGQAEFLDGVMDYYGIESVQVLYLFLDEEMSFERLIERGRADDNHETIKHRLEQYHSTTTPVLDYFKSHPRFAIIDIDGRKTIEEVRDSILYALEIK